LACASTNVELQGQADVSDALAAQVAQAIMNYFRLCGVLADRRR
jgi:predicted deacylase